MSLNTLIARLSAAERYAFASGALLLAAIIFREILTASMLVHMLVHIPLILAAGMLASRACAARHNNKNDKNGVWSRGVALCRAYDEYGVPGLLLLSFIGAYWMIPKALDQVQASFSAEIFKFFVLFIAGIILVDSLERANPVIKLFFVGNFSWMSAIVGLLYQDDSVRLCNFYLLDDQVLAGIGLVVLAIALPLFWLLAEFKAVKRFLRN